MTASGETADRDPLAVLADLRHRSARVYAGIASSYEVTELADEMPRLLAGYDALLDAHKPGRLVVLGQLCSHHGAHRHFSIDVNEAASVRSCPDCTATVYSSCTGCGAHVSVDRCPVRSVITAALTGEEIPWS